MDQRNGIEYKNKSYTYGQLMRQRRQEYTIGKDNLFKSGIGKAGQPHVNQ